MQKRYAMAVCLSVRLSITVLVVDYFCLIYIIPTAKAENWT